MPSDEIREIDGKIQIALNELENALLNTGWGRSPALIAHGKLVALTSEKSALVTEKSVLSVDKLNESSKKLEGLTIILVIFTIVLSVLTLFLIIKG